MPCTIHAPHPACPSGNTPIPPQLTFLGFRMEGLLGCSINFGFRTFRRIFQIWRLDSLFYVNLAVPLGSCNLSPWVTKFFMCKYKDVCDPEQPNQGIFGLTKETMYVISAFPISYFYRRILKAPPANPWT